MVCDKRISKEKLKATGNATLAECAVKDTIRGIGLSMKDSARLDQTKWQGQNLLGYALMAVRDKLVKSDLIAYGIEREQQGYTVIAEILSPKRICA